MLIQNKSPTVVAVIPCLGKVARLRCSNRERKDDGGKGRREGLSPTVACGRVVAAVCVRWHCNAVGGFVRGLPAEPLGTSRRRNTRGHGRDIVYRSVGRIRCGTHGKNNVAESERGRERERQTRGGHEIGGWKREKREARKQRREQKWNVTANLEESAFFWTRATCERNYI